MKEDSIPMKESRHPCLFQRRKEARPEEIVRAAQEVFCKKGYAATRIEDVAVRAGVSKGTIYIYFKSKKLLFKSVIEEGLAPALDATAGLTIGDGRPVVQLRRYFDAWQRVLGEKWRTRLLTLLAAESENFPEVIQWFHESVVCHAKRALTDICEIGIANGDFRPFRADIVADIFFSPISLSVLDDVGNRVSSHEALSKITSDILIRGLDEVAK